ncbi:MAG: hypothetical protein EOP38_21610 [Rubrivivax sp.]|nr:MAG: hypothetical protein EOP38_21610 [Rubrivivax sp.]
MNSPFPKKHKGNDTQITLGEGWRQFAFPQEDVELLGVIRRGMEIGALAKDPSGAYFQLNGDMRQTLNKSRVQSLLRSAKVLQPRVPVVRQPSPEERAAVVVVVKPRRRVVVPA